MYSAEQCFDYGIFLKIVSLTKDSKKAFMMKFSNAVVPTKSIIYRIVHRFVRGCVVPPEKFLVKFVFIEASVS